MMKRPAALRRPAAASTCFPKSSPQENPTADTTPDESHESLGSVPASVPALKLSSIFLDVTATVK